MNNSLEEAKSKLDLLHKQFTELSFQLESENQTNAEQDAAEKEKIVYE